MLWLDLGEYRGPSRFHAFVMFCAARRRKRDVERVYEVYVTDALQAIPQNKCMSKRFYDVIRIRQDIDVEAVVDRVVSAIGSEE